ncbi:oxysterol-binding protein-related protein 9-like [Tubulanus polymorphus]|uniref:oxysterol-binding protein-related protein 9-like n=1 Tax=Tubulanus polymorphus TaxID=672921 RepID=UPI003DA481DA
MTTIEGPLSKWTNVMKGWQYRWFVLDENAGLLSYYTSKEKMMRGSRRGCVRLKGAIIGIDDEDDSTFTITVDQKTFHFQARDGDEREKWVNGLEDAIVRHSSARRDDARTAVSSMASFDRKLSEADAYLQLLIEQIRGLEDRMEYVTTDPATREKLSNVKTTAEAMVESIKQTIVHLQIAKQNTISPLLDGPSFQSLINNNANNNPELLSATTATVTASMKSVPDNAIVAATTTEVKAAQNGVVTRPVVAPSTFPDVSYSSSDEDDFFDAEEGSSSKLTPKLSPTGKTGKIPKTLDDSADEDDAPVERIPPKVIASEDDQFDELYDCNEEDDLGSLDQHGSVITHLLSQVRIGMDLTKIVLPTFILEKRSLLEMYADFCAHPDLFVAIADQKTPQDRMVQVVRWYLSAFHASRRGEVAKKPYNPILGESFLCYWDIPTTNAADTNSKNGSRDNDDELATDGPIPWARKDSLAFIAEQVSHHPPISAMYVEHYNKRISMDGYIWTKSKFLGLSIGVHMIGQAVISVLDHDEEYILTFPSAYGRSILTVPWVELGGRIAVTCAKTGYSANIDFLTKPFYGGKKHRVTADIITPDDGKSFCRIEGEWNGVMWAKYTSGKNEKFVDTTAMAIHKKRVQPLDQQGEFESRRLWRDVTYNLKKGRIEDATEAKHKLEQRQREEAKDRKESGASIETKYFHEVGEHWVYDRSLTKRSIEVSSQQQSPSGSTHDDDNDDDDDDDDIDAPVVVPSPEETTDFSSCSSASSMAMTPAEESSEFVEVSSEVYEE